MLKQVKGSVLLMLSLLLVLTFPTSTWAHSKLETSTPPAGAKLTEAVQEVTLSFNENIDENLSTVKIKNEQGEAVEVADITVSANTILGTLTAPLPSGTYTVEWKIVGGDGHPIDGTYNFEVEVPVAETAPEAPAEEIEEPAAEEESAQGEAAPADEPEADHTDSAIDPNQQEDQASTNEESGSNGSMVWIIIVVVVAFIASYFGIKASRKKK